MKKRKIIGVILYASLLALTLLWVLRLFGVGVNEVPYSEVVRLIRSGQVQSFVVEDRTIELTLNAPVEGKMVVSSTLADPGAFLQEMDDVLQKQLDGGTLESYHVNPAKRTSPYDYIIPLLVVGLILLLLWALFMGRLNSTNPMSSFGKARTVLGVPDGKKVTFADVAGAHEEKEELKEIVDFLRDPEKHT